MSQRRNNRPARKRRVAIILDLDWPYKRQVDVYHGIIEQAGRLGWDHMLIPIAEGVPTKSGPRETWKALPFDGIIARASEDLASEAAKERIPLVNVWMNSPVRAQVPTVIPDFHAVGRRAANHLVARGLRNLAYLGGRRMLDCQMDFAGMREVARQHGASLSKLLIRINYNGSRARWEEYQSELHAWIDSLEAPFGIFTYLDLHARYVIEACEQKGLRVPEDVAVVGGGNELPLCMQPEPSITSIDHGFRQVGIRSVEILQALMDGKKPPSSNPVLIDESIQLMARHSTDVFAVDDALVAAALHYISEHSHEPINVGDVVRNLPASRRSLERRFCAAVDRSIAEEICRMRVRRLERLLVDSDERLVILAEQCGFSDTEQMRRNFNQFHGVTPSQYRKRIRG